MRLVDGERVPPGDAEGTTASNAALPIGLRLGAYRLLSILGEGGMGIVYLADQEQPIKRRVALKLVKLGMESRDVLARFESERQALALMTHPNIAKVFDAGRADDGRPFFVMEHVPGIPITDYCDQQRLTNHSRLELIIPVCEALHHAHQKGIVHRDVKPSNILVSVQDGRPVPRIIDFGISKALNQRLAEATVFTQLGLLMGTPEYMSPEQAEASLDIDTTSDVYSLGVVLYQLLVGALPFEVVKLRSAGYDEIRRIIREEEVVRPSTRLTHMGDEAEDVARRHHTDRLALRRELRGDLDSVTLKAMEKDRTRRYSSAAEFAADIRRHLADEPVIARPPSASYRMHKLLKRRKGAVLAVLSLIAALGLGLAASLVLYWQARAATSRAQREAYVANIRAVDLSLRSRALDEARYRLELAAPELRGWEWGHLALRTDAATRVLTAGRRVGAIAMTGIESSRSLEPGVSTVGVTGVPVEREALGNWHAVTWSGTAAESVEITPTLPPDIHSVPLSISRDGRLVVTDDQSVTTEGNRVRLGPTVRRVYDLASGTAIAELGTPSAHALINGAFSPDGRRIALATQAVNWSAEVRIWDRQTLQSVVVSPAVYKSLPTDMPLALGGLPTDIGPRARRPPSIAFSSRTARLAFVENGEIRVQDESHADQLRQLRAKGRPRQIALSSDGTLLFTVTSRGGQLFETTSGRELGTIEADEEWSAASFSPDDRLIAIGADNGTVRVFAPPTSDRHLQVQDGAALFGHRGPVRTLAFSPDGTSLVSGSADGTVRVWTAPYLGGLRTSSAAQGPVSAIAKGPDGSIATAEGRTVRVWDPRTGTTLATLDGHRQVVTSIAFSADGSQLVSGAGDGQVLLWSVKDRKILTVFASASRQINAVAMDPRGTYVASGDADQKIRMWNVRSSQLVGILEGHTAQVTALTASSDGQFIISGSEDGTVRIWNVATRRAVRTLTGHTGAICSVVLSPDERRILSSSRDQTLRLWSFSSGSELAVLRGHASDVTAGVFNSDGTRIISGSSDRTVRVWDATLGVPLLTLSNGNQLVSSVLFSADDRLVVSASFGGVFRIWEARGADAFPNQQSAVASHQR